MTHSPNLRRFALIVFVTVLLTGAAPRSVLGQTCDSVMLRRVQEHFDNGRLEEAKRPLVSCLPNGFQTEANRETALRIMALSYVAQDSTAMARFWVDLLVSSNTRFRANPQVDPPAFSAMVDDARPPAIAWLWKGSSPLQWVSRGAILGFAVALPVLLWPEGPPVPLPGPPALPTN